MMALLAEALRSSAIQTAEFRAQDGAAVIVQRAIGTAEPDSEEQYAVRLRRTDQPAEDRFAAENLLEVLGRLLALGVPGLDPGSTGWQPVTGDASAATGPAARSP
ncbi:MAG TPA: hypothetical protein VE258_15620 [Ktedonobacterales bacterium]|nr:hypothetical protein [Ktedonobacterales bacterium]